MASFSSAAAASSALADGRVVRGADGFPCLLQGEHHRHQALLGAVVEVALQSPALFFRGGHDPRPRLGDQLQLLLQLGLQALVLQRQPQDPGTAATSSGWSSRARSCTSAATGCSVSPTSVTLRACPGVSSSARPPPRPIHHPRPGAGAAGTDRPARGGGRRRRCCRPAGPGRRRIRPKDRELRACRGMATRIAMGTSTRAAKRPQLNSQPATPSNSNSRVWFASCSRTRRHRRSRRPLPGCPPPGSIRRAA